MDFDTLREWLTLENIMKVINEYRSFGPIPGILLPLFEAFLPFLPLFLFVMANTNAFGLWLGFLFSWIGSVTGALLVFLFIRRFGQRKALQFVKKHRQVQKLMQWVERHGFGPLFILLCFPFTPSAIVNIVAGLSKIGIYQYMLAVMIGKVVMIFTISYVGHDIQSLITKPLKAIVVGVVIVILWYVGKRIELRMNKKIELERKHSEG
nr:TVP38/TMEM64 family protein [uncultured Bacillus sp.]